MPQAGSNPPFAESSRSTEWESDALTNQATTAGCQSSLFLFFYVVYYFLILKLFKWVFFMLLIEVFYRPL